MIGLLEGRLVEKSPDGLVVLVGGVGYEVRAPLSTFLALPACGEQVRLRVHTHVREDALVLYGFQSEPERAAFRLLLGASGVGPRLALAILSGLPVPRLVAAVRQGEPAALVAVPGVGRKTAERILVELGDKIERLAGVEVADEGDGAQAAARSALENLGYTRAQAEAAVRAAAAELPRAAGLEKLIREALRAAAR